MHIHKDKGIDRVQVLDKFDASGNRRINGLHLYTFPPRSKQYFENFIRLSILF